MDVTVVPQAMMAALGAVFQHYVTFPGCRLCIAEKLGLVSSSLELPEVWRCASRNRSHLVWTGWRGLPSPHSTRRLMQNPHTAPAHGCNETVGRLPGDGEVQATGGKRGAQSTDLTDFDLFGRVQRPVFQPGDFGDPLGLVEKNVGQ